jgi:hypothetical protein
MKLRIRGNSVRVRLSQSELEQLTHVGVAEDRARFSPDAELVYRVEVSSEGDVRADLTGTTVSVSLPRSIFDQWLAPERVSIRGEQQAGATEILQILVEKDFACLAPRADEDERDLFPNPAGG